MLLTPNHAFMKHGDSIRDLTQDTNTDTVYVHPSEKQCNYSYTHPITRQCSRSGDAITDIQTYNITTDDTAMTVSEGSYIMICTVASQTSASSTSTPHLTITGYIYGRSNSIEVRSSLSQYGKHITVFMSVDVNTDMDYVISTTICGTSSNSQYPAVIDTVTSGSANFYFKSYPSDATLKFMKLA